MWKLSKQQLMDEQVMIYPDGVGENGLEIVI